MLFQFQLWAQAQEPVRWHPQPALSTEDKINDFAVMYGLQWLTYLSTQSQAIQKTARFQNMLEYPFRPHLDNDTFDYNVIQHTISGQYYFLYYRSKGHGRKDAFIWSFFSSLAFEFAIETLTERPSFQDIYQTPVFGAVLGMGSEKLSLILLSHSNALVRALGYFMNPFAMLPCSAYHAHVSPYVDPRSSGLLLTVRF